MHFGLQLLGQEHPNPVPVGAEQGISQHTLVDICFGIKFDQIDLHAELKIAKKIQNSLTLQE